MVIRTIEISLRTPFADLPTDIVAMLSPDEAAAYQSGTKFFSERAKRCTYRPIKNFFRMLSGASLEQLSLYAFEKPSYKAYFVFYLAKADRHLQVQLGPGSLPGNPPRALSQIYDHVNGTIDGREYVGGWESAEESQNINERRWQPNDAGGCDLSQSFPIYSFGNGDFAGYAGPKQTFL